MNHTADRNKAQFLPTNEKAITNHSFSAFFKQWVTEGVESRSVVIDISHYLSLPGPLVLTNSLSKKSDHGSIYCDLFSMNEMA